MRRWIVREHTSSGQSEKEWIREAIDNQSLKTRSKCLHSRLQTMVLYAFPHSVQRATFPRHTTPALYLYLPYFGLGSGLIAARVTRALVTRALVSSTS